MVIGYSTETGPERGHFGHLVRIVYFEISPRRVNRFLICFLIWTQPILQDSCKIIQFGTRLLQDSYKILQDMRVSSTRAIMPKMWMGGVGILCAIAHYRAALFRIGEFNVRYTKEVNFHLIISAQFGIL